MTSVILSHCNIIMWCTVILTKQHIYTVILDILKSWLYTVSIKGHKIEVCICQVVEQKILPLRRAMPAGSWTLPLKRTSLRTSFLFLTFLSFSCQQNYSIHPRGVFVFPTWNHMLLKVSKPLHNCGYTQAHKHNSLTRVLTLTLLVSCLSKQYILGSV